MHLLMSTSRGGTELATRALRKLMWPYCLARNMCVCGAVAYKGMSLFRHDILADAGLHDKPPRLFSVARLAGSFLNLSEPVHRAGYYIKTLDSMRTSR